jgi:hypothetical protein
LVPITPAVAVAAATIWASSEMRRSAASPMKKTATTPIATTQVAAPTPAMAAVIA